ncbi:MAG: hypothetical protein JW881_05830 [Spirochaetales bacterium]|nr:hypothetical protein [Spirochaetales bacterium]
MKKSDFFGGIVILILFLVPAANITAQSWWWGSTTTSSTANNTPSQTNPPVSGGGGALGCGTCTWYGTEYPLCCTTSSGWGRENNMSCISRSACEGAGQTVSGGGSGGTATTTSTWEWSSTTTTTSNQGSTTTSTSGSGGENTMGYCGCSMAENVANGYRAVGGRRMWGGYGTGGMVVQNWTDPNSGSWQLFDRQADKYGKPGAVWVQICIFSQGATYDEVKRMIAAARQHAAPGATIYITGQPLYPEGNVCSLAGGADGPPSTDRLAQQAGNDSSLNVIYSGTFTLRNSEVADGCHANSAGEQSLGNRAVEKWGR